MSSGCWATAWWIGSQATRTTRRRPRWSRPSRSSPRGGTCNARRSSARINQALAATAGRIGAFGKAFAGAFVAGGLAGLAQGVRGATRQMAALGDEARRAGVSVEAFQELKFVAEQNRVGVDSMVDGLKELSLRADEFIVTGKGPAAEAFARLGFDATTLARKLKEPDQLFLDIVGRMESLDDAARIRVADEVFGGTGGERFVQLIGQGEAGLRRTIEAARDAGVVLDEDLIRKADDLDKRFQALSTRVEAFGKTLAVSVADAALSVAGLQEGLDALFESQAQARSVLGEGAVADLQDNEAAIADNEAAIVALKVSYADLTNEAAILSAQLLQTSGGLTLMGESDAAATLYDISQEMNQLAIDMRDGAVSADEFEARMGALAQQAAVVASEVAGIDGARFGGVTGALNGFIAKLAEAAVQARNLRQSLPGSNGVGTTAQPVYGEVGARGDPRQFGIYRERSDLAPKSSSRPVQPGVDSFPALSLPGGGGGGGGGGGSGGTGGGGGGAVDAYRKAMEGARVDIRELEAEAAALVVLAVSGRDVGDALDYARKRAELLKAAQEGGKEITPALSAEIDALAEAYARAGVAASDAADDLRKVEESARAGADKLADIFGSILDGSMKAKDAIGGLLAQMAKVSFTRGFEGLAKSSGGKGFFGAIGSALGFATGGYTGSGSADRIAGVVHAREYVVNAGVVRRPGVRSMLDGINAGQMPQAPAAIAAASAPSRPSEVAVRVIGGDLMLSDGGEIMARVRVESESRLASNNAARDRAMPGKVNAVRANIHPRMR